MKRSTVEKIVQYLFRGLPLPFDILGQDSCDWWIKGDLSESPLGEAVHSE
jgi:hypothetical protein